MRILALTLPALLAAAPLASASHAPAPARHYHCPPCGCASQGRNFDRPGSCPDCGMALAVGDAPLVAADTKVAILVFPGVQIIDLGGPYETFGHAGFTVYTVAEKADSLTSAMGLKITPSYTFSNCPKPDVVVIPGGNLGGILEDKAVLAWIRSESGDAKKVLSVCNGAFILAKTGLLDGLTATTYAESIADLQRMEPKVHVVSDRRFADNGKFITTAGLSAGIDGALHVIEALKGRGTAQQVALTMEYDWRPEAGYVRAELADRQIPHLTLPDAHILQLLDTEGTRDHWHIAAEVESSLDAAALRGKLDAELATKFEWTRTNSTGNHTDWHFMGSDGRVWSGSTEVQARAGRAGAYRIALDIQRQAN